VVLEVVLLEEMAALEGVAETLTAVVD